MSRIHVVTGFQADALAPELARLEVTRVHNVDYASGMFSSVRQGVTSLPPEVDAFLMAPVDMPLIRPATIARLLRAAAAMPSAIVYPSFRGERGHPPLVRRSLFDEILKSDGDGGLRAVLARRQDQASEVAVFDWGCLVDMDRRSDYRLLSAAEAGRDVPDADECEAMFDVAATPEAIRRHGRAVAALAFGMARRLRATGAPIDPDLARAAALVHDIAKGRRRHADAGAAMLRDFGFPALAAPVARHMSLAFEGHLDESAIIYLADKLVQGETRVSLQARFAPALERFARDPSAREGVQRRLVTARAIASAFEARVGRLDTGDDAAQTAPTGEGEWPAAIAI